MGYYETTCGNCGGSAIFFSWSMSIECNTCRKRWEFVWLLTRMTACKLVIVLGWDVESFHRYVEVVSEGTLLVVRQILMEEDGDSEDREWMAMLTDIGMKGIEAELMRRSMKR